MRGPMSTPIQPSSMASLGTTSSSASSAKRSATRTSTGSWSWRLSRTASSISSRATAWPASSSCSDAPTGSPCAARNVKHMAPPIRRRSQRSSRRRMSGSLSLTLLPPSTATNGALAPAISPRAPRPRARAGARPARQQAGDPLGGGVRAVGRAEGVVHVVREALGELLGEGRVVRLLALVEAQVLEHHQVARRRARDALADLGPTPSGSSSTGRPISSPRRSAQGLQRQRRVALPLRRPEVRADGHAGARRQQPLERGHRRPDARVVGHAPVLQRHVQVGRAPGRGRRSSRPPGRRSRGGGAHPRPRGGRARPARPPGTSSPTRCRTRRSA